MVPSAFLHKDAIAFPSISLIEVRKPNIKSLTPIALGRMDSSRGNLQIARGSLKGTWHAGGSSSR
jgi:hypothetical protein